jgi:hypothetical protein
MSISQKIEEALIACEKVINGIEDRTLTVLSSLLLCKKIARLINDLDGQIWLDYEYGGYPKNISSDIWEIAASHGRLYTVEEKDGHYNKYIFTELCGELESSIESYMKAMNNYTTQGFSVSGDGAIVATSTLTNNVSMATNNLLSKIKTAERRLTILTSQYYDYAVRWQIELTFGNTAKTVFDQYRTRVDGYYSSLPITSLQKLSAIEDLMSDNNPEHYAQVITSCRRLWSEIATILFNDTLPNYSSKIFTTKSGKSIDVSGDHDNNKISAVIETLQSKSTKNTLVGSEIIYLIDWIEQISISQNIGVHHEVTREQAEQCIIHTYIALGDILSLKEALDKPK